MEGLTFSEFTKRIYIKAPLGSVYRSWATGRDICTWFLREARYSDSLGRLRDPDEPLQTGDRYTWKWHNWDPEETGFVAHANGRDTLEFSFAGVSQVQVQMQEEAKGTLLTLRQYGIPTDEESKLTLHYGCSNGWTFWLANLKAYLEHGVLLHDTDIDMGRFPLAGFEFVNM
jgi:uncharacterized protein YndB with AHSA1/START domain